MHLLPGWNFPTKRRAEQRDAIESQRLRATGQFFTGRRVLAAPDGFVDLSYQGVVRISRPD
jgi:hypothetical protein